MVPRPRHHLWIVTHKALALLLYLTVMHWLKKHRVVLSIGSFAVLFVALLVYRSITATPTWTTTTVNRGTVSEIVGVSGFVEAEAVAELSFPSAGIVTDVFVKTGDTVTAGQLLATLGSQKLIAERAALVASLAEATASRSELQAGPTAEERAVTSATVASAEQALAETKETEARKVANALAALLSNDLTAISTNSSEDAPAPTISGSYTCELEGTYTISVYASGGSSGFSYSYRGLESGIASASTNQPEPLGACGLTIQFAEDESYTNSEWTITVPNVQSPTYITYKNAYELAVRQAEQNIAAAENALAIANNEATAINAAPRVESLIRANAAVSSAQARIAAIDAQIADASIAAPFAGTITDVNIVSGETANLTPVMTMIGDTTYTLTARIPEIDITKMLPDQRANVRFDANVNETYTGVVTFVSPLPTTIDGVAYFEAKIKLDTVPTWIRAGLNADVDITITAKEDVLRIPERYIVRNGDTAQVLRPDGKSTVPQPVTINYTGNDGYVAISGLNEGDVIVAPQN